MAKTDTVKYEDRPRETVAALRGPNYATAAREFNLLAASTAEEVASALTSARLVLADILELGPERTGELRFRGGPISDLADALAALDQEAQP